MKQISIPETSEDLKTRYESVFRNLSIQENISPSEIRSLEGRLDAVYTQLLYDLSVFESLLNKVGRWKDYLKKVGILLSQQSHGDHWQVPLLLDVGVCFEEPPTLKTIAEREAWALAYAHSIPIGENDESLMDCLEILEDQVDFLKQVRNLLQEKHNRLILCASTHKTEASFMDTVLPPASSNGRDRHDGF